MARLSGRDLRSNFGSNLRMISELTGLDPWEVDNKEIKRHLSLAETEEVPHGEGWRINLLSKYIAARSETYYIQWQY